MQEETVKKRNWKRILGMILIPVSLVVLITAAVYVFVLPYRDAESEMRADSVLTLRQMEDGTLQLSWPAAEKTDYYSVEVLREAEVEGEKKTRMETLYTTSVSNATDCLLPELPLDEELTIRVNTMVGYEFPGDDKVRSGVEPAETKLYLQAPVIRDLQWTADPDNDSVTLAFSMLPGDSGQLFYLDEQGERQLLRTLGESEATVTFGENGDLPMLEHGDMCRLQLGSYREQPGSIYFGSFSEEIHVIREDLLDRNLLVNWTDEGENVCTLTWTETKGTGYEVQLLDEAAGQWVTIHTVDQTGERKYTSDHLGAFHGYRFRVVATGGQTLQDSGFAAWSNTVRFMTREKTLYTTIWPIKELEVFSDPERTEAIGKVAAGSTLCIVEYHEGAFGIRLEDGVIGYIDSNFCMIDLAEYLGELCSYDVTNSYSSQYMINRYNIPRITGKVVVGYENVRMADGTYLVPLLYPVAQKLINAAQNAQKAGFRLKIYDAYRPNYATAVLYNWTEEILDDPVPGNIPDPNADNEEKLLTYGKVMTNDVYDLGYFLARGASLHNLGIALDLTIEKLDTGEEQSMQSKMHDLSHYSMLYRNNENANILAGFMKDAGFGELVSEWWHFQDNDIRNELVLPALWGGVTPEGWKLDDHGWRYRNADGTYAVDCTMTISEVEYTFDAQGYIMTN